MARQINRRQLLKNSALISSGLLIAGNQGCGSIKARPKIKRKSPNEKLNIACIGVGGRGQSNFRGVREENIVALCDVDDKQAAKIYNNHPNVPKFKDFRVMLDKIKDIDAVVVSTPDHVHPIASVTAMKMGKHVYCEKPLAPTVWEARMMNEVAKDTGATTQMGNQGHANEGARRAVEMLRAGAIGPVREVHAWSDRPVNWWPQGIERPRETKPVPAHLDWDLWLGPRPERPYHPIYHPFKWRGWWMFGSGALGDMGCHITDLFFWAFEPGPPISVVAEVPKIYVETAPEWQIIRWKFAAGKYSPPLTLTWYDGGKQPPKKLFQGEKKIPGNGSLFIGDNGTMYVPSAYCGKFKLLPEKKFVDFPAPKPYIPNSIGHHAEWIKACKTGEPTGSNFGYAGPMTETILLGCVAARVKGPIEWDAKIMRVTNNNAGNLYVHPPTFRKGWKM